MPTKVASGGTGATDVRLSGPTTAACGVPSSCQKTRPHVSLATAVIVAMSSLTHVHTVEIHDESDGRVVNVKPTAAPYRSCRGGGHVRA
jgi:hypothetical protein